jgi:cell wall-associated NlpC family hydrolase
MKNRYSFVPILSAVAFLLAVHPRVTAQASQAQPEISTPSAVSTTTAPVTAAPSTASTAATLPPHTTNYTVVKGDTLTSLSSKFNTTRRKLKELNNLADSKITPGQVLLVPFYKKSAKSLAAASAAKAKTHHYAMAQPVQDFDVPASTFASCPVPVPDEDADATPSTSGAASVTNEKSAPVAQLVSPSELTADQAAAQKLAQKAAIKAAVEKAVAATQAASMTTPTAAPIANTTPVTGFSSRRFSTTQGPSLKLAPAPSGWANPSTAPRNSSHGILSFFRSNPATSTPSSDWGNRFIQEARALGAQGIGYDDSWRPPGEAHSWEMDCSNTSRYLYKVTANIQLPRTASDQYYYLHLQGKAWDVPTNQYGLADTDYLRQHLKPGDLLFWENTYRPERQPPITHVMVYLGTNAQGQWIMAGSQGSRGGEHNRSNGGPDIYVFRPSAPCGGYTSWFVHHKGRFCAFGRPLEADPSKFALND